MTEDILESQQIAWMFETKARPGQRPVVEALIHEAIAATRADAKAINYEFFMNGDVLHVFEKYADSPATLAHLVWFGEHIAPRFLAVADVTRFTIYGSPSADVRAILDTMGATYLSSFGGFAR